MWVERSPSATVAAPDADGVGGPLFVVINPGSGGSDAAQIRESLSQVFTQAGRRAFFTEVAHPGLLVDAFNEAAQSARKEGGIVVAVGGDGTINSAAQAVMSQGCPLGVIPQGTFNLLARDRGIPMELEDAAHALLRASATPVQMGVLNDQVFHLNASLGLYPQLLQDRENFNAQFGRRRWVAIVAALVTLFRWRRQMTLDIELDGERTLLTTPTLFVANNRLQVERIGLDEPVAASVGQGRLAGLVVRPIGSWAMLGLVLRGALGRLGEADQVHDFSFQRLNVRLRTRRRVKVSTDGEVRLMTPPLCFSVAPEPLLLMIPAPEDRASRE